MPESSLNGSKMRTHLAERYVLRHRGSGQYLRVNDQNQQIEAIESPESAWNFHSHEGAITHALWIGEVHGQTPDVVKMR